MPSARPAATRPTCRDRRARQRPRCPQLHRCCLTLQAFALPRLARRRARARIPARRPKRAPGLPSGASKQGSDERPLLAKNLLARSPLVAATNPVSPRALRLVEHVVRGLVERFDVHALLELGDADRNRDLNPLALDEE